MIVVTWARRHASAAASWIRGAGRQPGFRRTALAAAAVLVLAATATTLAKTRSAQRIGTGAGAIVEYQTSHLVDGKSITASVRVFVLVPGDPALPTTLAVGVKEVDDATGAELFAGTATGAPGTFTVGEDFANARVTGQITVSSATPGATRVADSDVVWSPEEVTQKIKVRSTLKAARRGGKVEESKERHDGLVRRMTGVGLVRVSDPARPGYEFSITSTGLGCAWRTKNDSRGGLDGPPGALAATASGTWTGYWTWKWDGTKWVATWTWVWKAADSTWTTS
jgi:hypothetical protein